MRRIRIVYQDETVVVVDKPAGLLTMATDTERSKTLYAMLRAEANPKRPAEKIFIVHRLDREASGLLVFAKSVESKEHLQNQFKDHSAGRTYTAVVEGRVLPESLTIRSYLAENKAYRVYSTQNARSGKLAVTHIQVVKRNAKTTVLEVELETGRKHQIRVHLADSGHPIVGDKVYGGTVNPIGRLALHGSKLVFRHPRTHAVVRFTSAVPREFLTLK